MPSIHATRRHNHAVRTRVGLQRHAGAHAYTHTLSALPSSCASTAQMGSNRWGSPATINFRPFTTPSPPIKRRQCKCHITGQPKGCLARNLLIHVTVRTGRARVRDGARCIAWRGNRLGAIAAGAHTGGPRAVQQVLACLDQDALRGDDLRSRIGSVIFALTKPRATE